MQFANTDQLLRLIHEGGLLSKLRGTGYKYKPNVSMDGPQFTIFRLTEIWTEKCFVLSNQMYARMQGKIIQTKQIRCCCNTPLAGQAVMLADALISSG